MSRSCVATDPSLEALVRCLRSDADRQRGSDAARLAALVAWTGSARALWVDPARRRSARRAGRVEEWSAEAEREAAYWSRLAPTRGTSRLSRGRLARLPECAAGDWREVLLHRAGPTLLVLEFEREIEEAERARFEPVLSRFTVAESSGGDAKSDPESERLLRIGRGAGALVHDLRHLLTLAELQLQRARLEADHAAAGEWLASLGATIAEARVCCSSGLAGAIREPAAEHRDLSQLVRDAARAAAEIGARGEAVSVLAECPAGLFSGRDPIALARLVRNLVLNAIEASPDGSVVHVDSRAIGDRHVSLCVRDQGRGIPAEDLERLYTRACSGGRGTGLGTLSVLDAVVRLRGVLDVDSRPGAGTTVEVRFPARATGPEVVLVDPWAVRRSVRAAELERRGAEVRSAADPAAALAELDLGGRSVARILIARGAAGAGLALLLERARTLGVPHAWIGADEAV